MKYLRRIREKRITDIYKIYERAIKFVDEQFKENKFAAMMVQASLIEEITKHLLILKYVSEIKLDTEEEPEETDKKIDRVNENSFARNINLAHTLKCISLSIKKNLNDYREIRNETIHEAFYTTIKSKEIKKLICKGNKLIDYLSKKIFLLNNRTFKE